MNILFRLHESWEHHLHQYSNEKYICARSMLFRYAAAVALNTNHTFDTQFNFLILFLPSLRTLYQHCLVYLKQSAILEVRNASFAATLKSMPLFAPLFWVIIQFYMQMNDSLVKLDVYMHDAVWKITYIYKYNIAVSIFFILVI